MTYRYCLWNLIHLISPQFSQEGLGRWRKLDFCGASQGQVSGCGKIILFPFLHFAIYFLFNYWSGVHDLPALQTEFMCRFCLKDTWLQHIISERGLLWSTGHVVFTVSHSFDPFWGWSTVFVNGVLSVQMKTFRESSTDAVPGVSYHIRFPQFIFSRRKQNLLCVCISYWFKCYLGKKISSVLDSLFQNN